VKDFQLSGSVYSPREVMEVLFRRKMPMVTVYVTLLLVCVLYVFLWPPTYRASVRFLVKNTRQESTISADQNAIHMIEPPPVSEDDLNSESAILLSHTVVEKTVSQAGIATMPEHWAIRLIRAPLDQIRHLYNVYHGKPDRTAYEQGILRLMKNVSASVEQRSDILTLNVDWGDPRVAAMIADIMAKNYLEQQVAVRKNPQAVSDFFQKQLAAKHDELEDIGTQIQSISSTGHLDALVHERTNIQDEASNVEREWRNDRVSLAKLNSQLQAQHAAEMTTPSTVVASDRGVVNAEALSSLRLQVVELERRRAELLQKYQPGNRLVLENAREVDIAASALKDAESPAHEQTTTVNPVTQMLQTNSVGDRVTIAGTAAHQRALSTEQKNIQEKLRMLNSQSLPLEQLELERKAAEDSYLAYARQYDESRIDDALDNNHFSNVVMIEPVRASDSPIKPAAKLMFELSLPLGLLIAIGFGFLLEFLDHTVKGPADVGSLNVPILATFRFVHTPAASSTLS
jgi:uncharacterized protein involved in exopolysaccharide biosynthesis